MKSNRSVKIADVGLAKREKDITGTVAGTCVYMAPEVLKSDRYGSKADIYSLGLMFWEIWYGEQAFSTTRVTSLGDFLNMLLKGIRPQAVRGSKPPLPQWEEIMQGCWKTDPDKRPTAAEYCKLLLPICKQYGLVVIVPKRILKLA